MLKKSEVEERRVLKIISAEYIKDYKININFSNGVEKVINFEPFLRQARNPMTSKYLDKGEFKKFKVEYGDLIWNDYELYFPIIDLYEDKLSVYGNMSSVA